MSVIFSGYVSNIWNMFQKLNKLYYGPYIYQLALEISSHETILPQPLKCFFYIIYIITIQQQWPLCVGVDDLHCLILIQTKQRKTNTSS